MQIWIGCRFALNDIGPIGWRDACGARAGQTTGRYRRARGVSDVQNGEDVVERQLKPRQQQQSAATGEDLHVADEFKQSD